MKRILCLLFVLPLLLSCAKNGEYKVCNDDILVGGGDDEKELISENPNSEVCRVDYYKDDKRWASKFYIDDKLIIENTNKNDVRYEMKYNKNGDTTSQIIWDGPVIYRKYLNFDNKTDKLIESEVFVTFPEVKEVEELKAFYNSEGKLITQKSGCINNKRKFCDCPTENINKYVLDFNKELAEAKKQELNREIDAFVDKTIKR